MARKATKVWVELLVSRASANGAESGAPGDVISVASDEAKRMIAAGQAKKASAPK